MKRIVGCSLLLLLSPFARAANWPDRPTLQAVRVATAPVIDGDLSDAMWQSAPEFTDFTQHDPDDGKAGTMRTSFRVLYDDHAIYFGAVMEDPQRPTALLARRDSFLPSDFLSINIDSQHDRLSGAAFTVTPSNMQIDSILYNDIGEDGNWDGVWESESRIVPGGWVAEIRVPFSQLRFPEKPSHTWGINVTRRTVRNNEWVRIVNTRKGETGFVSHFADLAGLDGIHRERQLELVPYAVVRSDVRTRIDENNPLVESQDQKIDGGIDLKYALTSTLTLTGTINPDFGQVEVDPAVVNLTEFETFYPEKRPFFTEGSNIFAFGDTPARSHFNFINPPRMFYSRRIGRSPQGSIAAQFVDSPAETTILGAAKVTGKMGDGWSVGVLDAVTDVERARYVNGDERGRLQVEPLTNYFVTRVTSEIGANTRVGILATSVDRKLPEELSPLRQSAQSAGVDGYTTFRKDWVFEWMAMGSRVSGSEEAITLTQRNSARYYQRPDAEHVDLDPSRTSLSGHGTRVMVSKQTGLWRPILQVQAYSPGFETNDVGFLQRSDVISSQAIMQYVAEEPTARVRDKRLWFGVWNNRNFDGDTIERGMFADGGLTLPNYWSMSTAVFVAPGAFSDRLTRGGPLVRTPGSWSTDISVDSDDRKRFVVGLSGSFSGEDDGSYGRGLGVTASFKPSSNLRLSVSPYVNRSHSRNQYVTSNFDPTATETYGRRYIFAELEQRSFELATRADWTLSSRLSFQLYMQPFVAAGDFHDYHSLVRARSQDYTPHAPAFNDPDFNFRSVRGSAVVRWEFRPGSALYVVWNENRAEEVPLGDFRIRRDTRAISTAPSHDVFLVKFSYWLPI
ncbi:MAG: DUF5916 domain-containing protein [Acidobacteriota bacterium]